MSETDSNSLPLDITPEQLRAARDNGNSLQLIDCREPHEWDKARIEGATLIPMGDTAQRINELDPDRPLVIFCHGGVRSRVVADFLRKQGFEQAQSLAGGIDLWSRRIDPSVPRY